MRKGMKDVVKQPSLANMFHIDFHDFLERESRLNELELSRDLGMSIGEVRYLKKKIHKS